MTFTHLLAETCLLPKFACCLQYDQDVVTWSPQGRIHQIEYAMEAVKQGSAAVGLKVGAALASCSTLASRARGACDHSSCICCIDRHVMTVPATTASAARQQTCAAQKVSSGCACIRGLVAMSEGLRCIRLPQHAQGWCHSTLRWCRCPMCTIREPVAKPLGLQGLAGTP